MFRESTRVGVVEIQRRVSENMEAKKWYADRQSKVALKSEEGQGGNIGKERRSSYYTVGNQSFDESAESGV